jgi:nitrogen regulatory protein P-II 1
MGMKLMEAIIRPELLETLQIALESAGYPGMMVTEVEGHGRQRGKVQQWRGQQLRTTYVRKVKVEIVVPDAKLKSLMKTVLEVCRSGSVGDGKIFVYPVQDAIRIRTGDRGVKALS